MKKTILCIYCLLSIYACLFITIFIRCCCIEKIDTPVIIPEDGNIYIL